jgi:hypothetical protein
MTRGLLVCLLLSVVLSAAHAAAPPPQWLAQESWPGGRQHDARLGRTVMLWGTGVPAAQVFERVEEQTGVHIGFFPPDDVNRRVCVNVYLNPDHPPTLRDLMAQLSWATDCAFATSGEGEERRYFLLRSSVGHDAYERVRALDPMEVSAETVMRQAAERHPLAVAMLPELREALRLSREEAIDRYRGRNDRLLLALLDPSERPTAQLIASLSEQEVGALRAARGFDRPWEEWTPEQRGFIREILRQSCAHIPADMVEEAPNVEVRIDEPGWLEQFGLSISVGGYQVGGFGAEVIPTLPPPEPLGRLAGLNAIVSFGLLDSSYGPLAPQQAVHLRRLLGEPMSDEEEDRLANEAYRQRKEEEAQEEVRERARQQRTLSPAAAASLASLHLPVRPDGEYRLWQLQEVVAARSGRHVVSDCFWQPARPLAPAYALLTSPEAEPDALAVLTAACTGRFGSGGLIPKRHMALDTPGMLGDPLPAAGEALNWEWGDAGDFLRFRSQERDVWRVAFLPEATIATLDAWLEPYLAEWDRASEVAIAVDPRRWAPLIAPLTIEQERWGGQLIYADPADPKAALRHSLHQQLTPSDPTGDPSIYRLLARLSDDEWAQLQSEGLVWGKDVSLAPSAEERRVRPRYPFEPGDLLRLGPVESRDDLWESIAAFRTLRTTLGPGTDRDRYRVPLRYWLATTRRLGSESPAHLVSPPPEYAQ